MKSLNPYLRLLFTSMLACSLAACSDDAGDKNQDNPPAENPDGPDNPGPGQDEPGPDGPDDPGPDDPIVKPEKPEQGWEGILLPAGPTELEIPNSGFSKISVQLISTKNDDTYGLGYFGEKIQWGVETGSESISLSAKKSSTADNGIANITVNATDVSGNAVVVAKSNIAPQLVRFSIHVLDKPTGNLNVKTEYTGNAPVQNYSIRIYDGSEVQCALIDLNDSEVLNAKTDAPAEPLLPKVDAETALFENLSLEQDYAIIAYGFSPDGARVAAGCLDSGINLIASDTIEATIQLQTIDLDPVSTYHVRSYFDLGDVASALGSVGKFVVRVTDFANNPGESLYSLIMDLITESLGGVISKIADFILSNTFKKDLVDAINKMAKENETVNKIGLFACQFRNIVRTMEFMGELGIEKVGSVELKGTDSYDGVAAYWRLDCTDSHDPNCGRVPLSSKQLGLDDTLYFLEGTWSGSIANDYDKLAIESHEMNLYYGKIIVYLINNYLLPKLADGATSFNEALKKWINCDSVGAWLSNTLTRCIGGEVLGKCIGYDLNVSKSQATGWCGSAVNVLATVLNFAAAYEELQKAGSDINISGTAMFKDTNADNKVDIIRDGDWSGYMTVTTSTTDSDGNTVKNSTTTGVRGIWSAYNMKNVDTGSGMYCTYPKTETDSNDQQCHYPEIDFSILAGDGLCSQYKW
ncbi:MAG: hypothetical protein J6A01_03255 [Proteobacteria bacterium]|nr:hypothetical protein [Pseudomonadota bacterium]